MLGIPGWAIGVGLIMLIIGVTQIVGRLVAPESAHRSGKVRKGRFMDPTEHQALAEVESRLLELDQLKQRVSELEERLDFTERMLASQRDAQRLGPPRA